MAAASPNPKNWEPGAHCTACRLLSRLEGPIVVVLSVSAVLSIVLSGEGPSVIWSVSDLVELLSCLVPQW